MFNDPLFTEEAKLKIIEREEEAEAYGRSRQLGYTDRGIGCWAFVLFVLVIATMLAMILF